MHRFFIPDDRIIQNTVTIKGAPVHRLRNVLRLGTGDRIVVLDDSGWEYEVELRTIHENVVEGAVTGKTRSAGEPVTRITLYQALLKGSSFEYVLQKCTEIGVSAFVPLTCDRCVATRPSNSRFARWQRVILEAAQQSRRGKLPVMHPAARFHDIFESLTGDSVLLWEEEHRGFRDILRSLLTPGHSHEINLFVGPEGGFSSEEVAFARSHGIISAGMGNRILRAETAGLAAAAVTLYEFGDLGGDVTSPRL